MDSFREQMGEDWLRYQHHLPDTSALESGHRVIEVIAENHCTSLPPMTNNIDFTMPRLDVLPVPLLSSESKREEEEILSFQPETESTLQWTGHSFVDIESTLETSLGDPQPSGPANTNVASEEEEDLGGL